MGTPQWNHPKLAFAPELLGNVLSNSTLQLPCLHLVSLWPQPREVLSQLCRARLHRAGAGVIRTFVWFLFPRALGLSYSDFSEQALNLDGASSMLVFKRFFFFFFDSSLHSHSLS